MVRHLQAGLNLQTLKSKEKKQPTTNQTKKFQPNNKITHTDTKFANIMKM